MVSLHLMLLSLFRSPLPLPVHLKVSWPQTWAQWHKASSRSAIPSEASSPPTLPKPPKPLHPFIPAPPHPPSPHLPHPPRDPANPRSAVKNQGLPECHRGQSSCHEQHTTCWQGSQGASWAPSLCCLMRTWLGAARWGPWSLTTSRVQSRACTTASGPQPGSIMQIMKLHLCLIHGACYSVDLHR